MEVPYKINFDKIGDPEIGYISVGQYREHLPFEIKRVYWVYDTPENVERGGHAHRTNAQVMVAIKGVISVYLTDPAGKEQNFVLNNPSEGLYVPPMFWKNIAFQKNAILLSIASGYYDASDYIRDFKDFLNQT